MLPHLSSLRLLLTATALWLCTALPARAQNNAQSVEEPYKFDLGLAMGMSGYWGDLSNNMFQNPGIAATAMFHYRFDTRWLIRGSFTGASLSGNNKKADNVLPGGMYEFDGGFYALDARAEFNFFSFGMGETYKRLKRWTPYLAVGLGGAMSSVDSSTSFAMTIPMAFGARYKVSERVNLGAEWSFMKVFGDKVDGHSDLTGVKTDFIRSTDWVSTIQIYFTYEFGRRCTACNRHD
ncbi:MAG: porin family protein [Candidatus Amulumruptor caecigallinarius]|nr:porin family protein [Candidatus Amulumruptor caecigallinarius]MCM1396564.1 porin family protein [Candidatus Amulumruptor caecigallinarius]MCM1453378.1 porin family protein [bacterium]